MIIYHSSGSLGRMMFDLVEETKLTVFSLDLNVSSLDEFSCQKKMFDLKQKQVNRKMLKDIFLQSK